MIEPTFPNVCGLLFCFVIGMYVFLRICKACGEWEERQITGGSTPATSANTRSTKRRKVSKVVKKL